MSKTMTGAEVRSAFLDYFAERGHTRVASSPLLPANDPSLLFTNAGMNQFKDVFTGKEQRSYRRATSSQKCVRAGGKHNDLENVGFTARHHTFFEMLGNFSFGDYFKADAIKWAWELVTGVYELPPGKLAITIFAGHEQIPADEEAAALWRAQGVPHDRLFRLGKKDNFWQMGDTGPCGPCSEIHIYRGPHIDPAYISRHGAAFFAENAEEKWPAAELGPYDGDAWMEIWNLVFMQFEQKAGGVMTPLPKPSIDTGAGLERLTSVMQGAKTNYDTDLFRPIILEAAHAAQKHYGRGNQADDTAMRVLADHARATTFLMSDGVWPSNEGRGYVLRRIMRRAIRYGRLLAPRSEDLFHTVCAAVVDSMGAAYPELKAAWPTVSDFVKNETTGFVAVLDRGTALLNGEIEKASTTTLAGDVAFKLYDTYGFPLDLTELMARERGLTVDEAGFNRLMDAQRGRGSFAGSGDSGVADVYKALHGKLGDTAFLGYDALEGDAHVTAIVKGGGSEDIAHAGDVAQIVTDRTPFYGESGGQVGDTGAINTNGGQADVTDCTRPFGQLFVHHVKVTHGELRVGDSVQLRVDEPRRRAIRRNHSATHLLHRVLKDVLGAHVNQAGSVVHPDYLRFDFTHMKPLSDADLRTVEARVNDLVVDNYEATTKVMALEEARASGAAALFGEKYGDQVRVLAMGPSMELCGGTHVSRTGDIGLFKIASEGAIASGVRRIVALTGPAAVLSVQNEEIEIAKAAAAFKASPKELAAKAVAAAEKIKDLEKQLAALSGKLASGQSKDLAAGARIVNGVKILAHRSETGDAKALRDLADKLRDELQSGIVVLGGEKDGKALVLVAVTKDLVGRYKAFDLVKELAAVMGGSGGGKPDLAQAGGDPAKLDDALKRAYELV